MSLETYDMVIKCYQQELLGKNSTNLVSIVSTYSTLSKCCSIPCSYRCDLFSCALSVFRPRETLFQPHHSNLGVKSARHCSLEIWCCLWGSLIDHVYDCPHPLWPHLGGKSVLPSSKSSSARAGSGRSHSLTAKGLPGDYRFPSSLGILGFSCYLWTSSSHFDFRPATWPNLSLVGGIPTLWKIWVRQLGLWHSQYMESHKSHVPNHQPVSYDRAVAGTVCALIISRVLPEPVGWSTNKRLMGLFGCIKKLTAWHGAPAKTMEILKNYAEVQNP